MKFSSSCTSAALVVALASSAPATAQTSYEAAGHRLQADGVQVQVDTAELLGVSTPEIITIDVHNDPVGLEWLPGDPIREIPRQHWDDPSKRGEAARPPVNRVGQSMDVLAELQREFDAYGVHRAGDFSTPLHSFDGAPGTTLPPDPTGDIGRNHYVQAVNASGGTRVRVYDKVDGSMQANFVLSAQLGGTGACSSGLGDPIVIYDALADRWLLTEFSPQSGRSLCIYVSADGDATGSTWYRYAFQMPSFPDYPKYGVWTDGYYVTANESGTSGQRPLYVMERDKMLVGASARFVRVTVPNLAGFGFQQVTPAHFVGDLPPPTGAPGIYMRHVDDESHFPSANDPTKDYLQMWQMSINWTPATPSTQLVGPTRIDIAEFDSKLNGLSAFNAFPQPNGTKLDPLREPIMNVLMYRNLGSHEAIVGNMVTDVDGADTGGVRWFELRRTPPSVDWLLHQEGTYAPADLGGSADRWMAGIGIDGSGNLALAYSVTRQNPGIYPSLRYVGRLDSDPLGVMTTAEAELATGTRSQNADRWGDYHQMGVDPVDGCTFWFTGEYMGAAGGTNNTRVGAFRHDACGTPAFTLNVTPALIQACANPLPYSVAPVTINVGSVSDYDAPVALEFVGLPVGVSTSIATTPVSPLPATTTASITLDAGFVAGESILTLQGSAEGVVKNTDISLRVATEVPGQVTQSTPLDGAINQPLLPVLSWANSSQAAVNLVEVATDAAFTSLVFSGSVENATSIAVTTPLQSNTTYYWRVSPSNICGNGLSSLVRSFKTAPAPGDCDASTEVRTIMSEDFDRTLSGFTVSGTGSSNWALSTARPSPLSGGSAFKAINLGSVSDQRLTSQAINLPGDELPITLRFQNYRELEANGATGCYDAGLLEISVAGGEFVQISGASLINDPYRGVVSGSYSNPLAGKQAWCDSSPARPYADTLVDLSAWAGQSVQLRWRLGSDSSVGKEGWYVDDVRVQTCAAPVVDNDVIFADGFEVIAP